MIAGLERFLTELRREGISASPAEWLDALRSLERLGLDDRERFRHALRCTLVKRSSQREPFDRLFERFFAAPAWGGRGRERTAPGGGGERGRRPSTEDRCADPRGPEALARTVSALRDGTIRRSGRWRRVVLDPAAGAPGKERSAPVSAARPLRTELRRRLSTAEEREIAAQVPRLVERIRLRTGRRLRRSARGRLYLRRVFRDNLRHGGVPWVLPYRQRHPRRPRVVLLIDVSWSTARAAGLFLSIAGEFLRRMRDARVLLFVDRAVDATREVASWLALPPAEHVGGGDTRRSPPGTGIVRGGISFARLVGSLRGLNLHAPSDYGRTFHALSRSGLRPGGRTTALLVLGDGRTNRFDPQDWALEEIASRCGAVVWLVPEPVERWETGDSALSSYLAYADVAVEAGNLEGLARGVSELLRRL